jgi:hypothetical protein
MKSKQIIRSINEEIYTEAEKIEQNFCYFFGLLDNREFYVDNRTHGQIIDGRHVMVKLV